MTAAILGEHTFPNGRTYKVSDTGLPYVAGEYPSGGFLIVTKLLNGTWSYIDNSPDVDCVKNFLKVASRLPQIKETQMNACVMSIADAKKPTAAEELKVIIHSIEQRILRTPTGDVRNHLSNAAIALRLALNKMENENGD